jgi:hypothetical protein
VRTLHPPMSRMVKPRDEDIYAFWPLDEASGSFLDSGPDLNNLALTGSPSSLAQIQSGEGAVGARFVNKTQLGALGVTSYVGSITGSDSSVSFACWIRPREISGDHVIFRYGGTSGTTEQRNTLFSVVLLSSGRPAIRYQRTSSGTVVTHQAPVGATLVVGNRYLVGAKVQRAAATTWTPRFFIYGLDDGMFVEQLSSPNFLKSTGGNGSTTIRIGDPLGPGGFDIQDVMWSGYDFRKEWFRYQFMIGARKFDVGKMIGDNSQVVRTRARVEDANGNMLDMTSMPGGKDILVGVSTQLGVDDLTQRLTLELSKNAGAFNISPFVTSSPWNAGGKAIDTMRRVEVDVAVVPSDHVAFSHESTPEWLWERIYEGYTAKVRPGGLDGNVIVECNDLMHPLMRAFIKTNREYGTLDGSKTLAQTLQERINDNASLFKTGIPTPQIWDRDAALWVPTPRVQEHQHLAPALQAEAIFIGFDVRYIWDELRQEFRLSLMEPPRNKTTPDYTYPADVVYDMSALDVDDEWIINSVIVKYVREGATPDSDGQLPVDEETSSNAFSIARYGERAAILSVPSVQSATEAAQLASAVVSDLAEPEAIGQSAIEMNPYLELHDLIRFRAEGETYDTDLDLAVTAFSWGLTTSGQTMQLNLRGRPVGKFLTWKSVVIIPAGGKKDKLDEPFISTPVAPLLARGVGSVLISSPRPVNSMSAQWMLTEYHLSTTNDFTPSAATLVGQTAGSSMAVAGLDPSVPVYSKVVLVDKDGNKTPPSAQTVIQASYTVPGIPAFSALAPTGLQAVGDITPSKVAWSTLVYDLGVGGFSLANDRYTAPVLGLYRFMCRASGNDPAISWRLMIYRNGVEYARTLTETGSKTIEASIPLAAGSYVEIFAFALGKIDIENPSGMETVFEGKLEVDLS